MSKCWHGAPLTRKTCLTPYTTRSHDCEWINRCWLNCKYPLIARHRGSCDHANGIQQQTLHPKTKTFLWWILEGDRKAFIIFGHKGKCRRKWNSIYGRKRKRTFIFSGKKWKRKSPDNISVFVLFIRSVTKSALQCATNTSSSFAFFAGGSCWRDSTFLMYSV